MATDSVLSIRDLSIDFLTPRGTVHALRGVNIAVPRGSIVGIVVLGCVIGGMMPLILHRLGVDPASSSTPFIATLVDVLGILVYMGLAGWILGDLIAAATAS